jgi:hypothetical protein
MRSVIYHDHVLCVPATVTVLTVHRSCTLLRAKSALYQAKPALFFRRISQLPRGSEAI